MKKANIIIAIIAVMLIAGSCKKGKDPFKIKIKVESTCPFTMTYYFYYGSKYDPYYVANSTSWDRDLMIYEGNKILLKGKKESGGQDNNYTVFKLMKGDEVLASDSSNIDGKEVKVEYTYN